MILEAFGALVTEPWLGDAVGVVEVVGLLRLGCVVLWADDAREGVLVDRHVMCRVLEW